VKLGDEAFFELVHSDLPATAEAAAVFVGYGLTVPELNYDDFAGQTCGKDRSVREGRAEDDVDGDQGALSVGDERRKALRRRGD